VQTNRIELEMHHAHLEANNLGEYAHLSLLLLRDRGWDAMVLALCADSDVQPTVQDLPYLAAHVLNHLRRHGAP